MDPGVMMFVATAMYGFIIYLCGFPYTDKKKSLSSDFSLPVQDDFYESEDNFDSENQTTGNDLKTKVSNQTTGYDLKTKVSNQTTEFTDKELMSLACKGAEPISMIYVVVISYGNMVLGQYHSWTLMSSGTQNII